MKNFDSIRLLQILAPFDDEALDLKRRFGLVLSNLIDIGFHSARFYLKIESGASDQAHIIKILSCKYRDEKVPDRTGYSIALADTTIFIKNELERGFSIGDFESQSASSWPRDLYLAGTTWVDLVIRSPDTREIYGLLAVSWNGAQSLLTDEMLASLRLLASRISSWIAQRSERIVRLRGSLEQSFQVDAYTGRLTGDTLDRIKQFLGDAFLAECVACFEYDWNTASIEKICESIYDPSGTHQIFKENYKVGQYLTGMAFVKQEMMFIPDFYDFSIKEKDFIFSRSLDFHSKALGGGIQSCLYQFIQFGQKRYLFRLFRSAASRYGFFSKKDRDDLAAACQNLSSRLERKVREFQQLKIRQAATTGFHGLKLPQAEHSTLADYLFKAGIESFMITTCDEHDNVLEVRLARGAFGKFNNTRDLDSTEIGNQIRAFQKKGSATVLNLGMSELSVGQKLALKQEMEEISISEICLLSLQGVINYTSLTLGRARVELISTDLDTIGMSENEKGFLLSLLSIYAAANEASKSLITAEKADHMLADLGHEVGTPVSILTQTAILACDKCLYAIEQFRKPDFADKNVSDLKIELGDLKLEVNNLGGLIQIITEIPRALAQIGTNSLEMEFRTYEWADLLSDVWRDALDWSIVLDRQSFGAGRVPHGTFVVKSSENLRGQMFVGDYALLRIAVGNVVKNALKYSLPRHRNTPMEVGLFLEPQQGKTFLNVRNWGVGIPKESQRRIFGKYDRIDRQDRIRNISGRGIGLFLAKSFIRAHGGDIECRSSVPTLNDEARTQQLEGFETHFRMWIPSASTLGRRTVKL